MQNWAPLDVALGLTLVYFILSIIASALNEMLSTALGWRAKYLERWLRNVLADEGQRQATKESVQAFLNHPLIAGVSPAPRFFKTRKLAKRRAPSYLASTVFATAALSFGSSAGSSSDQLGAPEEEGPPEGDAMAGAATTTHSMAETTEEAIANLPSDHLRAVARTLVASGASTVEDLQKKMEQWYDDSMERVSGWYRRRVHIIVLVLGFSLAILLNADTVLIVQRLWSDTTVRAAVVAEAGRSVNTPPQGLANAADAAKNVSALSVPLGWKFGQPSAKEKAKGNTENLRDIPRSPRGWLAKLIGILLTGVALSLGAPFWFDLLSRFARIRVTGTPPPVSGGTRSGEGDQSREGPSVA